jgi:hypothetical protein
MHAHSPVTGALTFARNDGEVHGERGRSHALGARDALGHADARVRAGFSCSHARREIPTTRFVPSDSEAMNRIAGKPNADSMTQRLNLAWLGEREVVSASV